MDNICYCFYTVVVWTLFPTCVFLYMYIIVSATLLVSTVYLYSTFHRQSSQSRKKTRININCWFIQIMQNTQLVHITNEQVWWDWLENWERSINDSGADHLCYSFYLIYLSHNAVCHFSWQWLCVVFLSCCSLLRWWMIPLAQNPWCGGELDSHAKLRPHKVCFTSSSCTNTV